MVLAGALSVVVPAPTFSGVEGSLAGALASATVLTLKKKNTIIIYLQFFFFFRQKITYKFRPTNWPIFGTTKSRKQKQT